MPTLVGGVLGITGLLAKGINASGNVSQDLQVWGLSHLIGKTVSAFVNGEDVGDLTVAADGSVTIDISSSSHSVTAATIVSNDDDYGESTTAVTIQNGSTAVLVYAAIVIGLPFVSQGQRLRAATREDVRSDAGAALGMTRRTHMAAVLIQDAVVMRFGTLLTPTPTGNMFPADFKQADDATDIASGTMFSGVYVTPLEDGYTFDGALCWQIDRPWPCTILAVSQFLKAEERE